MRTLLYNGCLVRRDGVEQNGWLLMDNGTIIGIGCGTPSVYADNKVDAEGRYISPGFIDIHVHGGGGFDFMDGSPQAVIGMAKEHAKHGTTGIVPTSLSCPDEELIEAFACYREAKRIMKDGPRLLGIHLEGPYFAPEQAGAQDPAYLRTPVPENYLPILEAGGQDIVRVSAACELTGGLALGDELTRRGILASIGHSNAEYAQITEAMAHGYRHVTHLYSGMSMLRRVNAYRRLGVLESAFLLDGLSVEIIADGCHLPPELLQLIVKLIDPKRITLITDAMRGADMDPESTPLLGSLRHGQATVLRDGVAFLPDMSAFAGSICTSDRCVRTMVKQANVPMETAVSMMSDNPARLLGIQKHKGSLAIGMDADVCVFDDDVRISMVWAEGNRIL